MSKNSSKIHRTETKQAGFTLIEIAVAVFILGLALTTLIGLQTRIVSLYVEERNLTKAALYGQYLLSILDCELEPPKEGSIQESLDSKLRKLGYFKDLANKEQERENMKGWQYRMDVTEIDIYPFEAPLRRVDLKIFWDDSGEAFSLVYFYYDFNSGRRLPLVQ